MTRALRVALPLLVGIPFIGCDSNSTVQEPTAVGVSSGSTEQVETSKEAKSSASANDWFVDRSADCNIDFVHENGFTGERYIFEILGAGVAAFDYDLDGDVDLFFVDGDALERDPKPNSGSRLYRNDGKFQFTDVTTDANARVGGYGFGVAVGDADGDGDSDLYVTRFKKNALLRNRGDSTFELVDDALGAAAGGLSFSASFRDVDRDGNLDLYVTQYVEFTLASHKPCLSGGHEVFCAPKSYPSAPDYFFRGVAGRLVDASKAVGLHDVVYGAGLGVVSGDIDGDGLDDFYVANDGNANHLLLQRRDGDQIRFVEEALLYGCAFGETAKAEAGMGVDLGDVDADGDLDIAVTNLDAQSNSLYLNDSGIVAVESSFPLGIGRASLPYVGFGIRLADFDLDGDLDEFVTNGHIQDNIDVVRPGGQYAQKDVVLEQRGSKFVEVHGPNSTHPWPTRVGRSLMTADLDNDGDLDVVITSNGQPPVILENRIGDARSSIGFELIGKGPNNGGSNVNAYGAEVVLTSPDGSTRKAVVRADGSYLASHDPRVLFSAEPETDYSVEVRWPAGQTRTATLTSGAYHRIVESGEISSEPFNAKH